MSSSENALNTVDSADNTISAVDPAHDAIAAADAAHEASHSPLAQFEISKIFDLNLFGIDISFTNSALYMVLASVLVSAFLIFSTRKKALVPGKSQAVSEAVYNFVNSMISSGIGEGGAKFFPLIFSVFAFIGASNILGITPYSYTATSQIIVTLGIALMCFICIIGTGIYHHGFFGFLKSFAPKGVPAFMLPMIFVIELFSFLIRPITLSVRLFANMVAGHVLLKVVAGFILSLGLAGIFPFLFSVVMMGFEVFVAVLQAYIFAILVCAYIGQASHEH